MTITITANSNSEQVVRQFRQALNEAIEERLRQELAMLPPQPRGAPPTRYYTEKEVASLAAQGVRMNVEPVPSPRYGPGTRIRFLTARPRLYRQRPR